MIDKVNYNEISPVYNDRYKQSPLEGVEKYLVKTVQSYKPKNVLEVGCGTSHWLNQLHGFDCNLFGADYSLGMLSNKFISGTKINLLNADALHLPVKKSSFDMIYVVNAIHHFSNPFKFINDSFQYLKPGGRLLIIGLEPRESQYNWYMYKYFKRTYEIDINRFPTFEQIKTSMNCSGYGSIKIEQVHKIDIIKKGRDFLEDHFITKKGASQLALLSDEEYRKGIDKIKSDIEKSEAVGKESHFEIKLHFYAASGIKPV